MCALERTESCTVQPAGVGALPPSPPDAEEEEGINISKPVSKHLWLQSF